MPSPEAAHPEPRRWTGGPDRVALVDLSMRGARHGPFNAMLLRVVETALPHVPVTFWAESSHAAAVQALNTGWRAAFRPIALHARHIERDELVTVDRLLHALQTLREVVRAERRAGARRLVLVVSSLSATGLVAAGLLQRLARGVRVQFVLHGNLASLRGGWRPRNPVHRTLSLPAALRWAPGPHLRPMVLEETVAAALGRDLPEIARWIDVLPHPANADEPPGPDAAHPVPRVAMVGLATRAKGAETFLRLARVLAQDHPGRIELRLVGRLHPELAGLAPEATAWLADPPGTDELDRAGFVARIRAQDYVCLPYGGAYYELAASGSLLDAISCARPVIALEGPLLRTLFAQHGDIGHLCKDEAAILTVLRGLATHRDPGRYAAQVHAMTRLRDSRLPDALATSYHQQLIALGAA